MSKTPITREGLFQYDHLPAAEAALQAWTVEGKYPPYHHHIQNEIRAHMPVLARALDRMAVEARRA